MAAMKAHQRAPRTPDSYFNVSESVTLLNIVKSDRIQNAFQSNRKNHSSVWEMVASILNRYNDKKRTSKQCCNRYENLKKIYTQLKRNPEKHVRRNWPYMGLFKEIEDQRGESWGTNQKRIKTESYYQRRRAMMMMNNNTMTIADGMAKEQTNGGGVQPNSLGPAALAIENGIFNNGNNSITLIRKMPNYMNPPVTSANNTRNNNSEDCDDDEEDDDDTKDDHFNFSDIAIKKEYPDYEEDNDNSYMQNNYNGHPEIYMNGHNDSERNILHPDVIVDTDHVTDSSSISMRTKRKLSTSTDAESTNYELIEYLKKREKRDEEMFKRMEEREERLIRLLERTVVAIEHIASQNST